MKISVETSARHIHITDEHLEILFGGKLTKKKELSQPGQYACEEKLTVVGPKRELTGVTILGPTRKATQVELSATDARSIGIKGEIRESGDISGTPGCTLIGPKGQVEILEGVIVAKRHIHTTPADAEKLGVKDKEVVAIAIDTPQRKTIFGDVVVRVNSEFSTTVHIDTDESNAANCTPSTTCEIVK